MKITTSQNLSKRLTQYGALTVAIAGVASANGQGIVYSGPINIGGVGGSVGINFDSTGTDEFNITHLDASNYLVMGAAVSSNVNSMLGVGSVFNYPFALASGATISNNMSVLSNRLPTSLANSGAWINDGFQILNKSSCNNNYSQWCGVVDGFVGMRFKIGADDHYGWARLDIDADAGSSGNWILKDWAYNTTPDEPINAGQTVLGIEETQLSKVKIVAINKTIALFNLPQETTYNLYNLSGQKVLNGKINNSTHAIEVNSISTTGIYIIELEDANSKAVLRKKLVF